MNLNGNWKLYYYPTGSQTINSVDALKGATVPSIAATVPGNVELDLSDAGILPKDLFKGMNIMQAEKFESYEWWYETSFVPETPKEGKKVVLHFGGVDCYAEYFLNGEKIGESDNMFMPQDFNVTDKLLYGKENSLHVKIYSPIAKCNDYENELYISVYNWDFPLLSNWVRKAPHSYGWDIMPRALSAGIWRDVELRYENIYDIKFLFMSLHNIYGNEGQIKLCYDTTMPPELCFSNLRFEITGKCGDHTFHVTKYCKGKFGGFYFEVEDLKLWWPRNYGEPNMYDISVEIYGPDDTLLFTKDIRRGFRTAKLCRTDVVDDKNGCFHFEINGVKVMAVGSNWVPMDAYHSRDAKRYQKALELACEANCNILRCWGGNVYEDHAFFDFCDDHGIMVWQDFAMACASYPMAKEFLDRFEKEAEWVIKEYRDHASLVVWCGDNEIDIMRNSRNFDPETNLITRKLLPELIIRHDPQRSYLPSSPYISPEAFEKGAQYVTEDHLWGPRDYFKSDFYLNSKAYFVSETGYHGCPAKESIEKFIDAEYVWPYQNNEQWNLHSSDQNNSDSRTMLMDKQIVQLFGEVPDNLEDFVVASQISQAEAKKFFIERIRAKMDRMGGIIWWNLIDGWPQMSDAVVDYYYEKKLAFDFIKRSSQPFIIMIGEMSDWGQKILTANSTLNTVKGKCRISDLDSGEVVFEKEFEAAPNSNTVLGKLETMYSEQKMLLIEWETDEGKSFNTYLCGTPKFSFEKYKNWLQKINNM